MPRKAQASTDYMRGLKYLSAAKRITAIARTLDDTDGAGLRRAADTLTERGLSLVIQEARQLEAALQAMRAADQ